MTLDELLDLLDRHHQRATFEAVAGTLGIAPLEVMKGRARTPRHSWVVSGRTHRPPGYGRDQLHPDLEEQTRVIETSLELRDWLFEHRTPGVPVTLHLSESEYVRLARLADRGGRSIERWATDALLAAIRRTETDPLLMLAGCLESAPAPGEVDRDEPAAIGLEAEAAARSGDV